MNSLRGSRPKCCYKISGILFFDELSVNFFCTVIKFTVQHLEDGEGRDDNVAIHFQWP